MTHADWIKATVGLLWGICRDGYVIDDSQSKPALVPASEVFTTYHLTLGGQKAGRLLRDFLAMDGDKSSRWLYAISRTLGLA